MFQADLARQKKKSSAQKIRDYKKSNERNAFSNQKIRKRINTEEKKVCLSVRRRAPTVLAMTERSVD